MSKKSLTDKERKTLYGLVKHPDLNDRELAEMLDENLSTITAIRRRLRQRDYFFTRKIPNLQNLGFELLMIGYGGFNPSSTKNARREAYRTLTDFYDDMFLMYESPDTGMFMGVLKNYTAAKINMDTFQHFYSKHNLLEKDSWTFTLFPYEVSKAINMFNYAPLLRSLFKIREPDEEIDLKHEKSMPFRLTTKERKVLQGLVRYPELPDNAIAKKVGASRQALSGMKKKFEKEGVSKNIRVPNLKKLGYGIVGLIHTHFNPNTVLEDRKEGCRMLLKHLPHFFMISANFECIMLSGFRNFDEYTRIKNRIVSIYKEHDYIRSEPEITMFSLPTTDIPKNLVFTDILKKM